MRAGFAARAVLRTPGQSVLAVVALGLGIGLISTVFVRVEPGMQVFDPQPHAIVLGILAAATLVAYLVPEMRATRHEPASVLSSLR